MLDGDGGDGENELGEREHYFLEHIQTVQAMRAMCRRRRRVAQPNCFFLFLLFFEAKFSCSSK